MDHSRKKERWILYILVILLSMVLASFWLICNMYARYSTQTSGSDSARVAIFSHNETISLADSITEKLTEPGDSLNYTFEITNSENSKISEVGLTYQIQIETSGNLPLQYTLKKDNVKIGAFSEETNTESYVFKNENMKFEAGKQGSDRYTLEIVWPKDKNTAQLSSIPELIKMNIIVEQID